MKLLNDIEILSVHGGNCICTCVEGMCDPQNFGECCQTYGNCQNGCSSQKVGDVTDATACEVLCRNLFGGNLCTISCI
jgi:hypothetical protein